MLSSGFVLMQLIRVNINALHVILCKTYVDTYNLGIRYLQ